MSRKMIIDIDGSEYAFGLDRSEIKRAEKLGFDINKFNSMPMTQTDLFWSIGLHKYQPNLNLDKCYKLIEQYQNEDGDIQEVINFLSEEYTTFFLATLQDTKTLKKARVVEE